MTVFKIIHEQSLVVDEHDQIVEVRPWTRIELSYTAIQQGWFRRFEPNWIDLPILMAIGLHARPLFGDDLKMLIERDLAKPADEGRLYARLTDVGLADILGCSREWAGKAAARLSEKGLLRSIALPKNFQDSRGRFAGTEAFILPGEVLRLTTPDNLSDRVNLVHTVNHSRVNSVHTAGRHNDPDRVNSVRIKIIPTVSTPANAGGADAAPADFDSATQTDWVPDDEHAADQPTLDPSGNGSGAHRAEAATESAPGVYRSLEDIWQRLNAALGDDKIAAAFQGILETIEAPLGLTEAGLRAARLAFAPLPDRRRRVLDDLRRMQGRADLKASLRRRNVIGILTQNIGVTLGLGLSADGSLRALADRADYTAIGGLASAYGPEVVWLAACEIAGQRFEGEPIEYLRAVLRNKRIRESGQPATTLHSFDQLDYLSDQVGMGDT
jgi:hypothetical protein